MTSLPKTVSSPLTGADALLVRTIPPARLVDGYRQAYGWDASHIFRDIPEVGVYQCATGFAFYYPFTLAGDESLYRHLEKFDFNYKDDKWEYTVGLSYVRSGDQVLDVGCGEGKFLVKARDKGAHPFGIELNKAAAQIARDKGLQIHEKLLAETSGSYDVVTAFQVLEHVADPLNFVGHCIRLMRPGGTLVIGVPNNDGFLRLDPDNLLNQPPHHMGLWNRQSLLALAGITGLQSVAIETEGLAEREWYQAIIERRYLSAWQRRLWYRLGFAKMFARYVSENAGTIAGHTILAVYRR
jgi:2-polyprenyl-3-methyl-5-hydroxy-6-metoxy-1,4-benzoquinol methylase